MSLLRSIVQAREKEQNGAVSSTDSDEEPHLSDHIRSIDPSEGDIYNDALFAPLYLRYYRIQKGGEPRCKCKDYALAIFFLITNVALQLAIAVKMNDVTIAAYGDVEKDLFDGTCWRMGPRRGHLFETLWPQALHPPSSYVPPYWDCGQSLMTLSMSPEKLDLNRDGFWSTQEVSLLQSRFDGLNIATQKYPEAHRRMIRYDIKHRSSSNSTPGNLDLRFFEVFAGKLKMCLPTDPHMCGNLEDLGLLKPVLTAVEVEADLDVSDADDRIQACRRNFDNFCMYIFGELFHWFYLSGQKLCGDRSYAMEDGVNVVSYSTVSIYRGEEDSVLGTTFTSFLMMLLFVWGMLILHEFRSILNFAYVLWMVPSTPMDDPDFATITEEGQMEIKRLPVGHKIFGMVGVCFSRFLIAVVVFIVGTNFLAATTSLLDLVLNSTALGFLIEVDSMIHNAFLGEAFKNIVTQDCAPIRVPSRDALPSLRPIFYFTAMLTTLCGIMYYFYNKRRGFKDIGSALDCLCHMGGKCLARYFFDGS